MGASRRIAAAFNFEQIASTKGIEKIRVGEQIQAAGGIRDHDGPPARIGFSQHHPAQFHRKCLRGLGGGELPDLGDVRQQQGGRRIGDFAEPARRSAGEQQTQPG